MPAVLKFPSEVNILKKEWYNNWYKLRTYFMAFILVDMPLQVMFVLSYLIGSFLLSGQILEWIRLSKVFLVMFLSSVIASSMGIFFGTIVNPINGTFLGAIMLALMLVVAGFLILFNHMSATMYLLSYISYISYAISALVQAIYINRGTIPCPEDVEYCPYSVSVEFLKEMGMDKTNFWGDIAFLFLNIIALRIISFCTLKTPYQEYNGLKCYM
ncbi:hypothetical protein HHI36_010354 [Cryptolaemus montrouzieri]|uniref:ABC-2 type transporter transmembrane domain-containing protein n=1 Tax=Cryptolaemus montrouzieri TaxID=559131 RepID=A0ABD2MIP7_9CUCU